MGYTELPNELNESEMRIKTSQKYFSAGLQGRSLENFDFHIYGSQVMDQNIHFE